MSAYLFVCDRSHSSFALEEALGDYGVRVKGRPDKIFLPKDVDSVSLFV